MKIGLAQIRSSTGDIDRNISHHLDVLDHLGAGDVDLVMFPELSLSNYAPDIANSVAMEPDDIRLKPFQEFADRTGISVGVGIPLRSTNRPLISIIVFFANRIKTIIHKSYLHEDELPYFSVSSMPVTVLEMSRRVTVAICHEINVDAHIESAAAKGIDVYLASVAKTAVGLDAAREKLLVHASKFNIPVLVVNSVGTCEGKEAGGGSMVIGADGTVICSLDDTEEAILIYDFKIKNTQKLQI